MKDFSDDIAALRVRLEEARGYLRVDAGRDRLRELEALASAPDLWDDPDRARTVTTELANVKGDLDLWDDLAAVLDDLGAGAPVMDMPQSNAPVVRDEREKVGRNDPCWCGSGKKYKHCHGR